MELGIIRISERRKVAMLLFCLFIFLPFSASAQIGEHRNKFSVGVNGGYVMSNVGFTPTVTQGWHSGATAGVSFRYVCEKYFSTICSVMAEVNYASIGWKQDITTALDQPVIGDQGSAEKYERTINYVQIPVFAHLAWGREERGFNFFFHIGPQFGFYLNDKVSKNYNEPNISEEGGRGNTITAQETMPIENKFDYGIAAGGGVEYSHPKLGHFLLEGRYYYGLGNIYDDSKRDYFGKSNFGNIVIKATYFFDL